MQLFVIQRDGEVHTVNSADAIRNSLDPTQCFIITDDQKRMIYLWKGSQSSVRSKFIGASKSQEIRGQVGMHYKVIALDEGEEAEYPDLYERLDESPTTGFAQEIREEHDLKWESDATPTPTPVVKQAAPTPAPTPVAKPAAPTPSQPKSLKEFSPIGGGDADGAFQVMSSGGKVNQSKPLWTGESSSSSAPMGGRGQSAEPQLDFKKIMETLESLQIPEGYEREMIIIGNSAYSIVEKKSSFLGETKVDKIMEKIGSLPEGLFFAQGYAPRVLCENQKVVAIEFLKKTGASGSKLKAMSKDPKALAKQFGMEIN
ncbi:MAG: hypothetical protein EU530_01750 [Promethearchaeota archaeon]|nr:MAG: hypothetical protein EU530_01750 [Candidatus Lokiarchaeota archaeon]